jgi:hypothetical protein
MPDRTARELLKEKALDRWENEGGSIFAGPARVDECSPAVGRGGGDSQLLVPRVISYSY